MPKQSRKPRPAKHSQLQTKRTGWKAWLNSKVVVGLAAAVATSAAGSATTWELDHLGSTASSAVCTKIDTRTGPTTTEKLICTSTNGKINISPQP
jgi:hypothetical protein